MLRRFALPLLSASLCLTALAVLPALPGCEPPKVIPRCPGFEDVTCDADRRTLCVTLPDGCQECVCERLWTDRRTDAKPGAEAPEGGEGEGEASDEEQPEESEEDASAEG